VYALAAVKLNLNMTKKSGKNINRTQRTSIKTDAGKKTRAHAQALAEKLI
jgi:hypothetical protein